MMAPCPICREVREIGEKVGSCACDRRVRSGPDCDCHTCHSTNKIAAAVQEMSTSVCRLVDIISAHYNTSLHLDHHEGPPHDRHL